MSMVLYSVSNERGGETDTCTYVLREPDGKNEDD